MKQDDETLVLTFRPRSTETVSLEIPQDTLKSLLQVAQFRNMTLHGLLKLYIGHGLRQDLANFLTETTEVVNPKLESVTQVV